MYGWLFEFHHYDYLVFEVSRSVVLLQGEGDDIYLDTYEEDGEEAGIQAKGSLSDVEFDSDDEDWDSDELETELDDDDDDSASSTAPEATSGNLHNEERHLQP